MKTQLKMSAVRDIPATLRSSAGLAQVGIPMREILTKRRKAVNTMKTLNTHKDTIVLRLGKVFD